MKASLVLTTSSGQSDYRKIFELGVGDVFQFEHPLQWETVLDKVEKYKQTGDPVLDINYVNPGHSLFSLYGPNTAVITKKVV